MSERIRIDLADHVCRVTLARPDRMNALDPAMFEAIADAIRTLADMKEARVVLLSGEGRAFCAGLDLQAMAGGGSGFDLLARVHGPANLPQHVAWGWRSLPMPVIAAVHGVAFGGGLQIMSGADIRIAHPDTRFSIREVHWGLVPDMAGIALWKGLVRPDRLRELTYTAREFDAREAEAFGFVTRLADDPLAEAEALARSIAARSPDAVRGAKKLYDLSPDAGSAEILAAESEVQVAIRGKPNQMEAVEAGLAKRPPVFRD